MSASGDDTKPLRTKIRSKAQLLLCKGCCCGRTDRGLPAVPVDRIKALWKAEKLNRVVQLTISGCLGPCDLPNVAVVISPAEATWFGLIDGDDHYDALIAWARACRDEGAALPTPAELDAFRFDRFEAGEREDGSPSGASPAGGA